MLYFCFKSNFKIKVNMKRIKFVILFSLFISVCTAQLNGSSPKRTILLSGASFASPNNGWFELGCQVLDATPMNRAVGSESIANTANRMNAGTLFTKEEFENIDALLLMQVHEQDVFDESKLKDKYTDYETPINGSNYAVAFDYVIKRYLAECYNLKFDKNSKYFNTREGKPAVIILCTHWHDARVVYNSSVRKLAQKWGFPVVEFDKYIGFSKDSLHPVTGEQVSRLFAGDKQEINGVVYGWHPENGQDKYIQQRMAAIFADTMNKVFIFK